MPLLSVGYMCGINTNRHNAIEHAQSVFQIVCQLLFVEFVKVAKYTISIKTAKPFIYRAYIRFYNKYICNIIIKTRDSVKTRA